MQNVAIETLLDRQAVNGGPFWSRQDGDIHAPAGFSTIDVVNAAGEFGGRADEVPALEQAAKFLLDYQNSDGSFSYSKRKSKLPCMAARILGGLGRIGLDGNGVLASSYQWLSDTQSPDGGWRCATVKRGVSEATDASNPGTTLYVLDAFRFWPDNARQFDQLARAVEFVLARWQTRVPLGPCNFGIGSRFMQVEYPFLRYNLFFYVYVLSHYVCCRTDSRFLAAFEMLESNVKNDQMIVAKPHRSWADMGLVQAGQANEFASQRWREIVENLSQPNS